MLHRGLMWFIGKAACEFPTSIYLANANLTFEENNYLKNFFWVGLNKNPTSNGLWNRIMMDYDHTCRDSDEFDSLRCKSLSEK